MTRTLFLVALLLLEQSCQNSQPAQAPLLEVPVVEVQQRAVPIYQEFAGQTYGQSDIAIRARVNGWITGVHFKEGSEVKKGQLLYTMDPLQYQTKVDQAKGQLGAADANLANAEANLKRIRPLAEINAVSKRELDAAVAAFEAAKAQSAANRANVTNQSIELSYTRILSPIDGVIGLTKLREGDYVGSLSTAALTTVSDISRIRIRFSISEREYLRIQKVVQTQPDALAKSKEAQLILSDGSLFPEKGSLNFADREIDPATGTLTIQATFPNPGQLIRPGQFVRIKLILEEQSNALLIPQRAVIEMQGIFQVFVVDSDNKLAVRIVEAGQQVGNDWIINKGLSQGDRVALIGSVFIKPGSVIKPVAAEWPAKTQTN
ncbi:MAG TPA: efflux RND transporter periplasmic adaptor subunit [Cyclobacteriaceae bacterium]|nr:efflux RND transporter periplasmic adaptor subunit [Cyclobacteriaceae bacterium]